jgi:ATP-dependent helicase/nuclease subunit B
VRRCAVIPPSCDLVAEVAELLQGSDNDFSDNLVVFPGKRPAHFLRKVIADRTRSAYVPPAVLSIEEFIDQMYEMMSRPPLRKLEAIDAVAFLFDLHRTMERPIGGEGFLSLETFLSLGLRIFRDLEELVIEDVDRTRFSELESFIEAPLPPEIARSLQSLSRFVDTFYPAVQQAGFSSRSERYRFVSSHLSRAIVPWHRVILAGFYGLTAAEKHLFKKIVDWDDAFFLFQDGPDIREQIAFLGVEPKEEGEGTSRVRNQAIVHFHQSPDSHGQVFALSTLLAEQANAPGGNGLGQASEGQDGRESMERTAIVLPSPDTLFAVLYHVLPTAWGGEYNISLGYPLERTPTWGFLGSLMQLCITMDGDRLYVPDYLDFVLHPYTKNIYLEGKAELTRILFHTVEEILLKDRTRNFVTLEEIEGDEETFALAEKRIGQTESGFDRDKLRAHMRGIHDKLIRTLGLVENIGDFATRTREVLGYVYAQSSARLHPFFHPFAESFMEQLDLLGKSRVRDLAFRETRGYFHFLRRYIAHCFTPFDGTPLRGLQVLGFLETRNLQFDRTYVLDVNEDVIPDTRKEESLIPLLVRKSVGLPTYRERDMLSAYYFDTMVRGSREVHLFFVENARKEKSRFVERLLWERQQSEKSSESDRYISSLNYRLSLKSSEPKVVEKTPAIAEFLKSRPFDATSLDAYLRCPVQFYYRYVLNLRKKEEPWADVERVDIGKLVHTILFSYFAKRKGSILTAQDIDLDEMSSLVGSLFEEVYGPEPVGAVYLLKRQIQRQMEAYLKGYEIPQIARQTITVLDLEQKIERTVGPYLFRGIVDRIDRRGERTCIVDYKTAGSAKRYAIALDKLEPNTRETWGETIGSIQLPFYLLLCEGRQDTGVAETDATYLLLGRAHLDSRIEVPLFGEGTDREPAYDRAKQVILGLAREICDPHVLFDPVLRRKGVCAFCDYQYLCGTAG